MPRWQVRRRNRLSGEETTVTAAYGRAMRPLLSPDGQWLVYGTRPNAGTALWLREVRSGAERRVRRGVARVAQQSFSLSLDWLRGSPFRPDGTKQARGSDGEKEAIT